MVMWLPKDERRLLQGYYLKLKQAGKELHIEKINNWVPVMKSLCVKHAMNQFEKPQEHSNNSEDSDDGLDGLKKGIPEFFEINLVNIALKERGLINTKETIGATSPPRSISLTTNGYDLGRKYNSLWLRIKLWYEEYIKSHPIWLISSFLGGVITGLLVNWLSKILVTK
jgi:hypothetical protein